MNLDKDYWSDRYEKGLTGWDVGAPTPPITEYLSQVSNREVKILIPGAGNAHEAAFLFEEGFENVFVCDIASDPLERFAARNPSFPVHHLHCEDYFSLKGSYDIIVEQTFFCAQSPELRLQYVHKQHELLEDKGYIVGVLFSRHFERQGPPFGGSMEEYKSLFTPFFEINIMEPCTNSIPARMGSELFIKLIKSNKTMSGAKH